MCGRRFVLLGSVAVLFAACGGQAPPPAPAYAGKPPLVLNVASFEVEDQRQPLPEANFIDERRSKELAAATRRYLESRFQASGGTGSAVAIIEEASLTERLLADRSGGVVGLVTAEPTYRLDGRVAVRIVVRDDTGAERGYARTSLERSRTVRAGTSVMERDNDARQLTAQLLDQLDPALEQAVTESLRDWRGF
jgi:hypothetical protein